MTLSVLIPALLFVSELAFRVTLVLVILLRRTGDSTSRLAWLVVVLLVPVFGAVAYLLIGEVRLGSRRMDRHGRVVLEKRRQMLTHRAVEPAPITAIPSPFGQIASLAESVGGSTPLQGNQLTLLGDSQSFFTALIADIGASTEHVHLLTYIFLDDQSGQQVADALVEAESRGVECRLLVDAVGSAGFLKSELCSHLRSTGVDVVAALDANPLRALFHRIDIRNHRKIGIIDGRIGYTGSQNLAHPSFAPKKKYAPWVDCMIRIQGPIVHDLQLLFMEDWFLDTDDWLDSADSPAPAEHPDGVIAQLIGTGPNADNYGMRQVIDAAIHLAQSEIILTTPYFVPDDPTVSALRTAARRGVEVHLVVPARNDSFLVGAACRSYFDSLLGAGIIIHEFEPGLLHAKTLTVDRDLGIVSSANLDKRSFFINFEASLIVFDTDFASELRFLQTSYIDQSTQVDPVKWATRGWPRRLVHNAAGMLSPLL